MSDSATTPAGGRLVRDGNRLYRMESVTLRPQMRADDPRNEEKVRRLLDKAEEACLTDQGHRGEARLERSIEEVEIGAVAR